MILHALKEYYDRKAADPTSGIAPPGFEWKEIPYIIVLDENGIPVNIETTHEGEGKKKRAKRFLVPQSVKRAGSTIAPNLLWDNPAYALGIWRKDPRKTNRKSDEEMSQRVHEQHEAFINHFNSQLAPIQKVAIQATNKFLTIPDKEVRLKKFGDIAEELINDGSNITFRFVADAGPVIALKEVSDFIANAEAVRDSDVKEPCLITGQDDIVERLHAAIKGVIGAHPMGAKIVSFQKNSGFDSYGKEQGYNSPVGKTAAFAYTTALNALLGKDSSQRLLVGDATTVFWAAKDEDHEMEQAFSVFFSEPRKDNPDMQVEAVKSLFKALETGRYISDDSSRQFYVLGLSPNASRIAIRFWYHDTVAAMSEKIAQHFQDLSICHGPKEKDVLSLFRLLVSIAVQGKSENILPNLAGDTMRSILEGLPYPRTLLQAAVRRNRAEQNVSYPRASLIKACINRASRKNNSYNKEELLVSLDLENINIGYRLGRLFATLEKIQAESRNPKKILYEDSSPTIRDRFYGAASGTPVAVFATLMKLKNHHLAKLDNPGRRTNFEKLISEIVSEITTFPSHLSLDDQGRFAIGYYHQINNFYTAKPKPDTTENGEQ